LFIQREFNPNLSDEAAQIFTHYYQFLRKRERLPKDRKTIRMLESLIRISEAHARLMMRRDVIVLDAITTIIIMEHCLSSGLLEENFPVVMSFERYQEAKHEILLRLGLHPGNFPDPVIKSKSNKKKKNKNIDEFNVDHFMTERSEFTGFVSSQDERSGMNNQKNFYIDSSQTSTQMGKRFLNSQSSVDYSQKSKIGGTPSSKSGDGGMSFLNDNDMMDVDLNDTNDIEMRESDSNRGEKLDESKNDEDLIDLTSLINP